jgi:hypothetical protein
MTGEPVAGERELRTDSAVTASSTRGSTAPSRSWCTFFALFGFAVACVAFAPALSSGVPFSTWKIF